MQEREKQLLDAQEEKDKKMREQQLEESDSSGMGRSVLVRGGNGMTYRVPVSMLLRMMGR